MDRDSVCGLRLQAAERDCRGIIKGDEFGIYAAPVEDQANKKITFIYVVRPIPGHSDRIAKRLRPNVLRTSGQRLGSWRSCPGSHFLFDIA